MRGIFQLLLNNVFPSFFQVNHLQWAQIYLRSLPVMFLLFDFEDLCLGEDQFAWTASRIRGHHFSYWQKGRSVREVTLF